MNELRPQDLPLGARGPSSRNVALERRLHREVRGDVCFDAFTRGRYATDASIYQIMPMGVVFPRTAEDVATTLLIAREHGVPVIARGAGTSQNGQPIGPGVVLDFSRYLDAILSYDREGRVATVEPGLVLERLNARLKPDGLFFPVEPSTASRCTIGGMAGNNSSGARSLCYGKMVDNVLAIQALLPDGEAFAFGPVIANARGVTGSARIETLAERLFAIAEGEREEIARRFPKVQRRVGGYNLDALVGPEPNLAHLLVGSEGTLALSTSITLKLSPLPPHRVIGVCHFPTFRAAMETTRHLVALGPTAVELVDSNVLALGRGSPVFGPILARITRGTPDCLLIVEFSGNHRPHLDVNLQRLAECMADHGYPDAVVTVPDPAVQQQVWGMREACLNILTSMKGDAKPVSFIEDCAVPLEHLADYTEAVTAILEKHGTRGTWYAHASVGCLHVRPILNIKDGRDVVAMRAIAEEVCDLVRRLKGSYSGEHGDGISRSEFIAPLFGSRLAKAFAAVKTAFDPGNELNPGKIVAPYRMDDRSLLRFPPGYRIVTPERTALDWSEAGGFGAAVEQCNNNGTCRKLAGGSMCPSYRATRDEMHSTRGRANTLRLAMSGQLGPEAFTSSEMKATLDLCLACKACRRECPTGVDMARMKVEFLGHYHARHGLRIRDRLVSYLPRYAPAAARLRHVLNLRDAIPGVAALSEAAFGFSRGRTLPRWRRPWREPCRAALSSDVVGDKRDLVLFADTFNRYFEPDNMASAWRVLRAAGYRLHTPRHPSETRPLCCGRTFLANGLVEEARAEAARTADVLLPLIERGARIVGLEPSCLLTFRDEFAALLPRAQAEAIGSAAFLIEEVLEADLRSCAVKLPLEELGPRTAHLHGHCHQKAHGVMEPVEALLRRVPGLKVEPVESSCCGMAGAFGFAAEHIDVSFAIAELSLFPALRRVDPKDLLVADGTSCRHQIADGLKREAWHVVRVLDQALRA